MYEDWFKSIKLVSEEELAEVINSTQTENNNERLGIEGSDQEHEGERQDNWMVTVQLWGAC